MSDFLKKMAASSRERAARASMPPASELDMPLVPLRLDRFDVIAEIKANSPAAGLLANSGEDRVERARQYAHGGAAAISVLTEPSRFAGRLAHVREVAGAVPGIPVMRKDFLVDPVQIVEARANGASGVLLIVTMLPDTTLRAMLDCAAEHEMFVLLEAFDDADLKRLAGMLSPADSDRAVAGQLLFGINTRNLRTLTVDTDRLEALAGRLPRGRRVAESGICNPAQAQRAAELGYALVLVGAALMLSNDPSALVRSMRDAGRLVT